MSRNATTDRDEGIDLSPDQPGSDQPDQDVADVDPHGFWDGPSTEEHEPLVVPDEDSSIDEDRETRVYMGQVRHTEPERDELEALADWAAAQACDECRGAIEADHEPDGLPHDECRSALRASRLLRRYP